MHKHNKPTKKLNLNTQTVRDLDRTELQQPGGAGNMSNGIKTCLSCTICLVCYQ